MSNLKDFGIENGVLKKYKGNDEVVVIPDGVTKINPWAFYLCKSLTSITIPDSVTEIGEFAFSGCTSLTGITIPNGVTKIGKATFQNCESLTSITIPDSVTEIGECVFEDCKSFTSITIPNNVKKIGKNAFANCYNLEKITFLGRDTAITAAVFPYGKFPYGNNIKEIIFAKDFFGTSACRPTMLIPFVKELSVKEMAYLIIFQDDKWFAFIQLIKPDRNSLSKEVAEALSNAEKITPKMVERLISFTEWAYPEITAECVSKICATVALKDEKKAEKLSKAEVVIKGLENREIVNKEDSKGKLFGDLIDIKQLRQEAIVFTKGIRYKGKDEKCSPEILNALLSEYIDFYDEHHENLYGETCTVIMLKLKKDVFLPQLPDEIAKELDANELSDTLEGLVYSVSNKYRLWMYAYARFATEESVGKLVKHPPKGPTAKVTYWKENLAEALLLSNTKAAMEFAEKKRENR